MGIRVCLGPEVPVSPEKQSDLAQNCFGRPRSKSQGTVGDPRPGRTHRSNYVQVNVRGQGRALPSRITNRDRGTGCETGPPLFGLRRENKGLGLYTLSQSVRLSPRQKRTGAGTHLDLSLGDSGRVYHASSYLSIRERSPKTSFWVISLSPPLFGFRFFGESS